jgi:hypothetical protein
VGAEPPRCPAKTACEMRFVDPSVVTRVVSVLGICSDVLREHKTAYRNARLPYLSSETSSPTGRRVVGPYLPIGQPRGITAHGVTFHGRPRARLAKSLLHSGAVMRAAPNPAARAASKRFCTAG